MLAVLAWLAVGVVVGLGLVSVRRCQRLAAVWPLAVDPAHAAARDARYMSVYYAGNGASLAQAARYRAVLDVGGGHYAYHPRALNMLPSPYVGTKGDGSDVQPYDLLLPSHLGLANSGVAATLLGLPMRLVYALYVGTLSNVHGIVAWPPWMNVGQADDTAHALAYTRAAMRAAPPAKELVLFGTSRGSAVALNVYLSMTRAERARVRLVVLEGTFLDSRAVIEDRYGALGGRVVAWLLERVTRWRPNGRDFVLARATAAFREELRGGGSGAHFLVVTSRADRVVPPRNAVDVYDFLRLHLPAERVTMLTLEHSTHSGYAVENNADRAAYADAVVRLLPVEGTVTA